MILHWWWLRSDVLFGHLIFVILVIVPSEISPTFQIEPDQRFAMDDVKVRFGSSIALISAGNKVSFYSVLN